MFVCARIKRLFLLILFSFLSFSAFCKEGYELLIDGKNAFPRIIECIQNSKKSIYINMFIWRDDSIGNQIARECVAAADRGVKVTISKDTYGSICEHAEESGTSFFHKHLSSSEKIKINYLKKTYKNAITSDAKDSESSLYKKLMSHPNIQVQDQTFKADHSKFYIIDDEILILGGINIEDKENGADMSGRIYNDYMLLLNGKAYVTDFNYYRQTGKNSEKNIYFGMNRKAAKKADNIFQMEQLYLDIINQSQKELTIVMAYFSPLDNFVEAILASAKRGVNVRIVIPQSANFQDDSNKKTMKTLLKKSDGKIKVYFSPKMVHTKLVANEKLVSFGSCNITQKAFEQLDELNVFITKEEKLYEQILLSIEETIKKASQITDYKTIKFDSFTAFLEGFVV